METGMWMIVISVVTQNAKQTSSLTSRQMWCPWMVFEYNDAELSICSTTENSIIIVIISRIIIIIIIIISRIIIININISRIIIISISSSSIININISRIVIIIIIISKYLPYILAYKRAISGWILTLNLWGSAYTASQNQHSASQISLSDAHSVLSHTAWTISRPVDLHGCMGSAWWQGS